MDKIKQEDPYDLFKRWNWNIPSETNLSWKDGKINARTICLEETSISKVIITGDLDNGEIPFPLGDFRNLSFKISSPLSSWKNMPTTLRSNKTYFSVLLLCDNTPNSLENLETKHYDSLHIRNNKGESKNKINSLKGISPTCKEIVLHVNNNIKNFEGCGEKIEIINAWDTKINSLKGLENSFVKAMYIVPN